jgi:Uma2 family endonuclease
MEEISWDLYQRMLDEIGDGNTRLTFNNGRLEIISPSRFHERVKTVLGRLIETYGDAVEIVVERAGSTTFQRKDLLKGLEPHECYYVAHAEEIEDREELDLNIDPPPDLVIEIDLSHRGVARQPIYAAMSVPEIWKYDGSKVIPLHLKDGTPRRSRAWHFRNCR